MNNWKHIDFQPGDYVVLESEYYNDPLMVEEIKEDGSLGLWDGHAHSIWPVKFVKEYIPQ